MSLFQPISRDNFALTTDRIQLSADGPPRESMCFTAISVAPGDKNRNKTQSAVLYCQISAPISVRTSVALPKAVISFDDGAPMMSAGLGALISGLGEGCTAARAVLLGVGADASGVVGVMPSSAVQAANASITNRDKTPCRRDLVVTSGVSLV